MTFAATETETSLVAIILSVLGWLSFFVMWFSAQSWKGKAEESVDMYRIADKHAKRVKELEAAIARHMNAKGHDRCWENDIELYQVLNPHFDKMELGLPALPEWMHCCAMYWRDRQPPECRNG